MKIFIMVFIAITTVFIPNVSYANTQLKTDKSNVLSVNSNEQRFEKLLLSISKEQRKCIICDPLITNGDVLDEKEFETLKLLKPSAKEFTAEFCRIYNYEYVDSSDGTLLLRKKYGYSNNLPTVNFDDILDCLSKIIKISDLLSFPHNVTIRKMTEDLINPISPDELKLLNEGKKIESLSDDQKKLLYSLVTYIQYRGFDTVERVHTRLRGTKKTSAEFSMKNYFGIDYPIYSGRFNLENSQMILDVVLGKWVNTQATGQTIFDENKDARIENEKIISNIKDPTTPNSHVGFTKALYTRTFLNYFDSWKFGEKSRYFIDKPVGRNQMIIFGDEYSNPESIIKNICTLFNFKIKIIGDKTYIKDRNDIDNVDISNIKLNILNSIPFSLAESLDLQPIIIQKNNVDARIAVVKRSEKIYEYSIKRLRYLIEQKIKNSKDGKIPMLSSDDEVYDMVALSSFCTLVPTLIEIAKDFPGYLSSPEKFDSSTLMINLEEVAKTRVDPHHYRVNLIIKSKDSGGFNLNTILRIKD